MSEKSNIAWTDSTVNFWEGCTKLSTGCQHCYAEARDRRMMVEKVIHWGKGAPRRKSLSAVKQALTMNRKPWICDGCGEATKLQPEKSWRICGTPDQPLVCKCGCKTSHRRRIFSLSLSDWLDDEVPIEWLCEMLDTIRQCQNVVWILCTKRPGNWETRLRMVCVHLQCVKTHNHLENPLWHFLNRWIPWNGIHRFEPPKDIILLTSVENQEQADKRIPELLKIPAACRGLSLEPLLGPVDLNCITIKDKFPGCASFDVLNDRMIHHDDNNNYTIGIGKLDWLIVGGESGPSARSCNVAWVRSLVKHGQAAAVKVFVKQLGAKPVESQLVVGSASPGKDVPLGATRLITDKKGGDPAEWPVDLRVQEWPEVI